MLRVLGYKINYRQPKRLLFIEKNVDILFWFRHKSHYTSLGLESNASPQDIKSAYYKLSLKYHPDKNQGCKESVAKFREITEAYEILSNQNKKQIYDASLINRPYSESDWRRQHHSPRSYQYKQWSKPRTGRSEHYNYDEHYKQHYEEYEKQRQADFDYFRRRWEGDFRRRYPFEGKPDWSEYQEKQQEYYDWDDFKKKILPKKFLFYFISLWGTMCLFVLPWLDEEPPPTSKPKRTSTPIYYKVTRDDEKSSEN